MSETYGYDANGNLLNGGVGSNVYDYENHLVAAGGVSLVYDGDGNRVKETVATTTTSYLVAVQNLTGYAPVLDELQNGAVSRTYSYGLELINQRQSIAGPPRTSFYGYDVTTRCAFSPAPPVQSQKPTITTRSGS